MEYILHYEYIDNPPHSGFQNFKFFQIKKRGALGSLLAHTELLGLIGDEMGWGGLFEGEG